VQEGRFSLSIISARVGDAAVLVVGRRLAAHRSFYLSSRCCELLFITRTRVYI